MSHLVDPCLSCVFSFSLISSHNHHLTHYSEDLDFVCDSCFVLYYSIISWSNNYLQDFYNISGTILAQVRIKKTKHLTSQTLVQKRRGVSKYAHITYQMVTNRKRTIVELNMRETWVGKWQNYNFEGDFWNKSTDKKAFKTETAYRHIGHDILSKYQL